jgi:acyl carrier protein
MPMSKRQSAPVDASYYAERLTSYVRDNHSASFDPQTEQLFDYLDSVGFIQLIVYIEGELGIQLSPASLSLESCATVESFSQLLVEHAS